MKNLFKTRYRIVEDRFNGYEAQYRHWWCPFYLQIGTNSHSTVEKTEGFINRHYNKVVKYVDALSNKA